MEKQYSGLLVSQCLRFVLQGDFFISNSPRYAFSKATKRRETQTEQELVDDPSVFPLAIPLIIGPGAIATVILIAGAKPGLVGIASTGFITALVLLTVFVFFSAASRIEKLLGKTGIDVLTRLLGMLLAALSVQFVIEGLFEFFPII